MAVTLTPNRLLCVLLLERTDGLTIVQIIFVYGIFSAVAEGLGCMFRQRVDQGLVSWHKISHQWDRQARIAFENAKFHRA